MNKASFHWAFLTLLASSLTGCASPFQMFAKKPQSYDDFKAAKLAKQMPVAGSQTAPSGQVEIAELLHKGHAAFQQGNLPEAQSNYFAVVQRQPNHPVANHRLGVIADRQQDYLSAQRHYFAALQSSPRDANLLNDIGYSFLLQSRYNEAEQYLQAATRQNPTQSNAINNLGLLYAKQGQADRALAMFRRTNSEAESQAKLARLLPSGAAAMAPPATMLAQNPWGPQNSLNPPPGWNGAPNSGNEWNGSPTGPNNLPPVTPAGGNLPSPAINDPNSPYATQNLEEQMKYARRQAVLDRQARDLEERQRRDFALRQLREEEFARTNAANPNLPQPTEQNRWSPPPGSTPTATPNPNRPIVVGPPPSNPNGNPHSPTGWEHMPNGSMPPKGYMDSNPSPNSGAPINLLPNAQRESMPPNNSGSPLDAMPAWPNVSSGTGDDPARAASRLGMSAGPGNMFQITPGPTAAPNNSQNNSSGNSQNWPPANNRPNNLMTPNGVAPTTPSNWPANPNRQDYGLPMGEPPAGSLGPGNFGAPANSPPQDQLPPSGWYQTPNRFGFAPSANNQPANNTAAQPMSYSPNPGTRGAPPPQSRPANSSPMTQGFLPTTLGDNSLSVYEQMIQRQNAEINQIQQQLDAQRQLPGSENYFQTRPQRQ
ncbi:MAG: tetratricopeptide repeat protein [Planctomycetaceae bacterium]